MNVVIYFAALALILFAVVGAGVADLCLYLTGQPTISDYLRLNPLAFWIPVGLAGLVVLGLIIHLWVLFWSW